jgi:uncharacterized protein YkwD
MRRFLWCAVLLSVLTVVATATADATPASAQRETGLEQGIMREVNRVRSDHGLRPLVPARGLQAAAAFQSKALLVQGMFEHDSPAGGAFGDRLRRFYPIGPSRSWSVGENLLWSADGIDAPSAVKLWLDSPVHRKIMLDPAWREFGAGAVAAPSAPGIYASAGAVVVVTIDFGTRVGTTRAIAAAQA